MLNIKDKYSFILLFILFTGFSTNSFGEKWTVYDSYTSIKNVISFDNKVIGLSNTGLLVFDNEHKEIETYSKVSGLSYTSPTALNHVGKNIIIGYNNGGVNIIDGEEVYVIDDIIYSSTLKNKSISSIYVNKNDIYLSCDFGIVWIDAKKMEIKETWIVGDNSSQTQILDLCIYNNYIYAVNSAGIYKASMSPDINKMNYQNWRFHPKNGTSELSNIECFDGQLLVGCNGNENLYYFSESGEYNATPWRSSSLKTLKAVDDKLLIIEKSRLNIYRDNWDNMSTIQSLQWNDEAHNLSFNDAFIDSNGNLSIGSETEGLIISEDQKHGELITKKGPKSTDFQNMRIFNDKLYVVNGFLKNEWWNAWNPFHFTSFDATKDEWTTYLREDIEENKDLGFNDLTDIVVDPKDKDHIFVSSYGSGVMELQANICKNVFFYTNSTLVNANPTGRYTRIGGMDIDYDGTLWATNTISKAFLHRYKDGEWTSFTSPDGDNYPWVKRPYVVGSQIWVPKVLTPEIFVMSKDGSQKRVIKVRALFQNNSEITFTDPSMVTQMVLDKNGQVWVGTNKGVFVYAYPESSLTKQDFYAFQPSQNLDDNLFHPILESEQVTSVAIDEGNQKWIGTKNSGVYLFNQDGSVQLKHYDIDNSPIPTNDIRQIIVEPVTGEVFITTKQGVVSMKGDAIKGSITMDNISVYPSPYQQSKHSYVTIDGLAIDSEVRIVNSSNILIAVLQSKGGRVVWNGVDRFGHKTASGVYQVLVSNPDGTITGKSKILILN
ncbi:hypothetical protein K5X82_12520 [Halosquirtibacter xylanolyticus]|uniref:type IX secretion system anionic LPS delivery protein PorZ n=1 Tax=Halosquirtibacter xylanolyticus TaxID=3374599 RepID=UPI0037492384|nr:hypothetical protein K5X82_12520 [Prolixibacteraceae bacterium]